MGLHDGEFDAALLAARRGVAVPAPPPPPADLAAMAEAAGTDWQDSERDDGGSAAADARSELAARPRTPLLAALDFMMPSEYIAQLCLAGNAMAAVPEALFALPQVRALRRAHPPPLGARAHTQSHAASCGAWTSRAMRSRPSLRASAASARSRLSILTTTRCACVACGGQDASRSGGLCRAAPNSI